MTRLFVFAVALVGCRGLDDPEAGKEEGRASYANFRLASAVGVNTSAANVTIGGLLFTDCEGEEREVQTNAQVDLTAGGLLKLEPGEWCGLEVLLSEPLVAAGLTYGGLRWDLRLDVPEASVGDEDPFQILKDRFYVFEFSEPEWFRARDLMPEDTGVTSVFIDASHPNHSELVTRISLRSALLEDKDGDTAIDGYERVNGLVAGGANRQ